MATQFAKPSSVRSERLPKKVLIVDDDPDLGMLFSEALSAQGLCVSIAQRGEDALKLVAEEHPSLVFLDVALPDVRGLEMLDKLLSLDPNLNVILMTGNSSSSDAVQAIRKGAQDYLAKPFAIDQMRAHVERWLGAPSRPEAGEAAWDPEILAHFHQQGFIGKSPKMLSVFARLVRIAPFFRTALVCGETGTGKELVAHVLHNLSPAAAGPFVVCNAAAIVDTLFESELFGHIRGAFTGAGQDKRGLFEAANGGTLFLDEIAELPLAMQAKLLRVLQNREVLRVGSTQVKKVNVRVIAASNRDLRQMALLEQFRQDLYYRLAAVEIKLPRLSEREGDVLVLIRHFLRAFSSAYGKPCLTLTRPAQALLTQHTWPGNVRELENTLDYACMMAKRDVIDVDDLPDWLLDSRRAGSGDSKLISMEEVRINHARQVLNVVNGNRARAAEILGISRATLYRLVADVNASDRN